MLDENEKQAVKPLLLQSRIIQNFNQQNELNTEMSKVEEHVHEIQPVKVVPKEKGVFDANQEPVPLKYVPKRSQQIEEEPVVKNVVPIVKIDEPSLIETVIDPIKQSTFVDVMQESQFALQQG